MAQIVIEIPDAKAQEALLRISTALDYEENIYDDDTASIIPNPETRAQFVKRRIVDHLKSLARTGYRIAGQQTLEDQSTQSTEELNIS